LFHNAPPVSLATCLTNSSVPARLPGAAPSLVPVYLRFRATSESLVVRVDPAQDGRDEGCDKRFG
jgi:hypothetical protein